MLILNSIPLFLLSTRAEPNPPGFDAPDDPNFNCPPGFFFEGNHERQNGPSRCTMMTCQNHSDLPGCNDDTHTRNIPNKCESGDPEFCKLLHDIRDLLENGKCYTEDEIRKFVHKYEPPYIPGSGKFPSDKDYIDAMKRALEDARKLPSKCNII